jgi:uncharacterized YigZ family protein
MQEVQFYNTVQSKAQAEFKDRGSRFIAYVFPIESVEEAKKIIQELRREHPKAAHVCFAYRLDFQGQVFRANDDGEPSGSAGRPILGQIDSKQLFFTMVAVVRYFGGTLLGVPGLINAYKTATALALQLVPVVQKPIEKSFILHFDYTLMNEVMMALKQMNCSILQQESQLFCTITAGVPLSRVEEFQYRIKELRTVDFKAV